MYLTYHELPDHLLALKQSVSHPDVFVDTVIEGWGLRDKLKATYFPMPVLSKADQQRLRKKAIEFTYFNKTTLLRNVDKSQTLVGLGLYHLAMLAREDVSVTTSDTAGLNAIQQAFRPDL